MLRDERKMEIVSYEEYTHTHKHMYIYKLILNSSVEAKEGKGNTSSNKKTLARN